MTPTNGKVASILSPDSTGCGPLLPILDREPTSLRQQVFEHIRAYGQTARADVARALSISPASVTAQTSELITAGYLREVDGLQRGEAGRGRPPVALELIGEAQRVIGIKISGERHSAVLVDFAGNILADVTLATKSKRKTMDQMLNEIDSLIQSLLRQKNLNIDDIAAIGIGVSGLVDHQTGILLWSPLMSGTQMPLKSALQARFGVPVHIDNDSNLLALAELWFGQGRSKSDFIVVTIEHGVG
ncbi:MAG TPA: ROK family protein, partial [Paracoccaceae bacterium]|nr:ROK family protein [Paracoccaceae bacterium]